MLHRPSSSLVMYMYIYTIHVQICEFSTENLLFLVEYVQIKDRYLHRDDLLHKQKVGRMSRLMKLQLRPLDKDQVEEKEQSNKRKNVGCILYGNEDKILTTFAIPSDIPESIVLMRNKSLQSQLCVLYNKYIRMEVTMN